LTAVSSRVKSLYRSSSLSENGERNAVKSGLRKSAP